MDDGIRGLGLVRLKARRISIVPPRQVHDLARAYVRRCGGLGRFQNVQSLAVEEEGVFPEQPCQLRNYGMVFGNRLGLELAQGSFDLCGRQLHRTLLFAPWLDRRKETHVSLRLAGPPTSSGQTPLVASVIPHRVT